MGGGAVIVRRSTMRAAVEAARREQLVTARTIVDQQLAESMGWAAALRFVTALGWVADHEIDSETDTVRIKWRREAQTGG